MGDRFFFLMNPFRLLSAIRITGSRVFFSFFSSVCRIERGITLLRHGVFMHMSFPISKQTLSHTHTLASRHSALCHVRAKLTLSGAYRLLDCVEKKKSTISSRTHDSPFRIIRYQQLSCAPATSMCSRPAHEKTDLCAMHAVCRVYVLSSHELCKNQTLTAN